jgi:hypothetical protein
VVSCVTTSPLRFALLLGDSLDSKQYRMIYTIRSTSAPVRMQTDTVGFQGTISADTTEPSVITWLQRGITGMDPQIRIIWSKPVRVLQQQVHLTDTLGDTVLLTAAAGFSDTTHFSRSARLKPGKAYAFYLYRDSIRDLSGMSIPLRDSTDTLRTLKFTYQTLPADSLCYLLSGGASCVTREQHRIWLFLPLTRSETYRSADSSGFFRFDSIPAGKGTVSWFADYNNDASHTPGALHPWIAPEPYVPLYDTIEARARWEVEGITVPACDPCVRSAKTSGPAPRK